MGRFVSCIHMSERPSDKPPEHPSEEILTTSLPNVERVKPEVFPLGMSRELYLEARRRMLAMARGVCRHSGGSPEDAVQEAFVKATSKPTSQRPSITKKEKFVAWLVEVARYEALTLRLYGLRQAEREADFIEDISENVVVPPSVGGAEARKMLERVFTALKPDDQALLHALYVEGKTIGDIAIEQGRRPSTIDSRHRRLLDLLYAAIQASIVALVVLLPRRARAFVAHVKQQAPQLLVQVPQFGGAMAMTAACGMLLPTGSSVTTEPSRSVGLTPYSPSHMTMAQAAPLQPSFVPEVEPEEPKGLDAETNEWSAADMKSTKIANFLGETLVPLSFLIAPVITQAACVGTEQQTQPARQPEEEPDGSMDPYDRMCEVLRARGETCPPRETWNKW